MQHAPSLTLCVRAFTVWYLLQLHAFFRRRQRRCLIHFPMRDGRPFDFECTILFRRSRGKEGSDYRTLCTLLRALCSLLYFFSEFRFGRNVNFESNSMCSTFAFHFVSVAQYRVPLALALRWEMHKCTKNIIPSGARRSALEFARCER